MIDDNKQAKYYAKDEANIEGSYLQKASVLLESLPYIKEYSQKIVVIKIGGSMMENENILKSVLDDLVLMKYVGIKVVLLHGGGKQITGLMKEKGIDLSGHFPKNVDEFLAESFDYVITVCDHAKENCPVFLGDVKQQIHIGFEDPAEATGTEEEIMEEFRRIRDEIHERMEAFLGGRES